LLYNYFGVLYVQPERFKLIKTQQWRLKMKRILSFFLALLMIMGVVIAGGIVTAKETSPYVDVKPKRWSFKDIMYVTEKGLMNGTEPGKFAPTETMTRAMVVTVLYRLQGEPEVTYTSKFKDVKKNKWFTDAVLWAADNGIVKGVEAGVFDPMSTITREQLATIIMRYAENTYVITEERADIMGYSDYNKVRPFARDAMSWANAVGIVKGVTDSTLAPRKGATREEFASILKRFDEYDEFEYRIVYNRPQIFTSYTEKEYPLVDDADIYVSVDGDDNNDGKTINTPVETFAKAKELVRAIKETKKTGGIKVAFMAGEYGYLDNLTFTADDAGTAECPITYCAYGDGDVVFCNGVYIPESAFTLVDGAEKEMFIEGARKNIYKVELSGKIDKFEFTTRLFTEDGIATEARNPNSGFLSNMTTTVDPWSSIQLQLVLPKIIEKLSSVEGMKINGYLRTGWMNDTFDVLSYDPETKIMELDLFNSKNDYWIKYPNYELMFEGRIDDKVFFSNRPEFLDTDGEYWFDNSTSTLYVYNVKGDYAIDKGKEFVTLEKGAEYISFVGLEFNTTSESAIVLYANNFTVDQCKIGNVGGKAAVHAPYYVKGLTVTNSEIYNCVDSCVYIFSMADGDWLIDGLGFNDITPNVINLEEGHNVIVNNYFHHFTLPNYFSSAIEVTADVGTLIAHNHFYEGAHGAIRYNKSIGVTIEYNIFDRIMTKTYDFGAVYTCSAHTFRDNKIRYNLFMSIPVHAIYLDAETTGQEIYGNLFYGCLHTVVQNAGRANYYNDNVSIYCSAGMTRGYGMYGHILDGTADTVDVTQYGVYKNKPLPGDPMYQEWYRRWSELYDFSTDPADYRNPICIFSPASYASNNVSIGGPLVEYGMSDENVNYLYGENNVEYTEDENPLFVNPAHGDYRIRDDVDFFKIPLEEIGRY